MSFDVQAALAQRDANPYHDPHEVYLMTMLLLDRVLAHLLSLLPPPYREVRSLPLLGLDEDSVADVFHGFVNDWARVRNIPHTPPLRRAIARALVRAEHKVTVALAEGENT